MLTTTQSSVTYQGNGATTQFGFNFLVLQASQLIVSITNNNVSPAVTTVLQSSQYSVTGIGNATGGTVTYPASSGLPLPSGWCITIQRVVPYTQPTTLSNQGAFYPQVVESALDNLAMQIQQLSVGTSPTILELNAYQPNLSYITPQMFGPWVAKLTDSATQASNAATLQAAINAAQTTPGARLILPPGDYYYSSGVSVAAMTPFYVEGAIGTYEYGDPHTISYPAFGANLHYTGAGAAWTFATTRDVTLKNFRLIGPGMTVSGSVGLAWTMSGGSFRDHICVQGFQHCDYLGYTSDGNGSENRWDNCAYMNTQVGIYLSQSQNYTNLMIYCNIIASQTCIKANESIDYTVIGGSCQTANTYIGNGLYAATVSSISAGAPGTLTLSSVANLAVGMDIVCEYNCYVAGSYGPKYNCVLGKITAINTSTKTVTVTSVFSGVQVGANVIAGYFPRIFVGASFSVRGVRIEQDAETDGNVYAPIIIDANAYGGGSVKMEHSIINLSACGATEWNKLVPLIHVNGGTQAENITFEFCHNNEINFPYPQFDISTFTSARVHDCTFTNEPIWINSGSGYYPGALILERVSYYAPWGENPNDCAYTYKVINDPVMSRAGLAAPTPLYPPVAYSVPTDGAMNDFIMAKGTGTGSFMGWKQTNGAQGDGYYRSEALTSTGTIALGSQALSVTKPYEFWNYEFITIAGAGTSGADLTARIEGIDGAAKVLYINEPCATAVTGAAISRVEPTFVKFGIPNLGVGTAVTSATSITPTGSIFHVTGANEIDTIVLPAGFSGSITMIPDAAFTTATSGNIAIASTAVIGKALIMTYDPGTSKWYPSY